MYASIASELRSHMAARLRHLGSARRSASISASRSQESQATEQSVAVPLPFGGVDDRPRRRVVLPTVVYTPVGTIVVALLVGVPLPCARSSRWLRIRRAQLGAAAARAARPGRRRSGGVQATGSSLLKALFRATEGAFGRHAKWRSIERLLVRGDVPLRPAEFVWLMIGCAVGAGVLFSAAGVPALCHARRHRRSAACCRTASSRSG